MKRFAQASRDFQIKKLAENIKMEHPSQPLKDLDDNEDNTNKDRHEDHEGKLRMKMTEKVAHVLWMKLSKCQASNCTTSVRNVRQVLRVRWGCTITPAVNMKVIVIPVNTASIRLLTRRILRNIKSLFSVIIMAQNRVMRNLFMKVQNILVNV